MNCPRRHMCWQSKRFYWERAPGWRAEGKGTQENCSVTWLAVLGFMVMGLVSNGLSVANHSDSENFLVVYALFNQDGCQRERFWEVVGHVESPFEFSRTLPVGEGFLVVFFTRTSCLKTTHANGYYGAWPGWAVSVSVLPLTKPQGLLSLILSSSCSSDLFFLAKE